MPPSWLASARPAATVRRLGFFIGGCSSESDRQAREYSAPLLKALAELDHVRDRTLSVEWRCFQADSVRGAQIAAELVGLGLDAIWTTGTPHTKLLQHATKTVPIVTSVADPVASGFARSLHKPGGNITGLTQGHPDTPATRIGLLRSVVPGADRIALLGDAGYGGSRELLRPYELAARAVGMAAEVRIVDTSEFERTFTEMSRSRMRAAYISFADADRAAPTTKLAIRHGVATMYHFPPNVERGGLMSFRLYHGNFNQRTAAVIDKVFRGIHPADIPWELPDRSHFAINLATAKALNLAIPSDLLLRADQVIE